MKYITIALVLLLGSVSTVMADQKVVFQWLAGNCTDAFRVYRLANTGWVEIAEVIETRLEIVVPSVMTYWKISGICGSGVNKGEWWMNQGAWTGKDVWVDKKRK